MPHCVGLAKAVDIGRVADVLGAGTDRARDRVLERGVGVREHTRYVPSDHVSV